MQPKKEQLEIWHKDPNNWKLGVFYYNKEDNRFFVNKRLGNLGATINFAHPKAYLFIVGIAAFILLVLFTVNLI